MLLNQLCACMTKLGNQSVHLRHLLSSCSRLIPCCILARQKCAQSTISVHNVKPFGQLVFKGPGNVEIVALNPEDYPNMDKCVLHCEVEPAQWHVLAQDNLCSIKSISDQHNGTGSWTVQVPVKYDAEVLCGGSASVTGLESSRVTVTAGDSVTLTAVRAGHVAVRTDGTVHVRKALLGNVRFTAKDVDSPSARLQGQTVEVSARRSCHLSDVYADHVRLETGSADVRVGTLHGNSSIRVLGEGKIIIGGVDGSLQLEAPAAAVSCHVHRLSADSRLNCGGAVSLTLAPDLVCRLEVRGPPPSLDGWLGAARSVGRLHTCLVGGGGGPRLLVHSDRPTDVRLRSWAAGLVGWAE